MRWEPILQGDLAADAARAASEIAAAVAAAPEQAAPADRTLFWAYACHAIDESYASAAYDAALDELVAELSRGVGHPALYGGLAGIGWTLCHILEDGAEDALAVIDDALLRLLAVERWPGAHDLTQGLVGIGVYFLERIASANADSAHAGLARVVRHLAALATTTDDGTAWHTGPELLPDLLRASWPAGYHDVGVAHGVPGTVALLARAAELPGAPAASEARTLCEGAVRWLAARRAAADPHGRFPTRIGPGEAPGRSRAAWCYGDPGIAAALWRAAPGLARETALESVRRKLATCGVVDAGLCHGAAGLAHLFNRFYQASGAPIFADAARAWFARTLDMRRPDGFGGFVAWHAPALDASPAYRPVANFLEGSIGIGLALLAAITPASEPRWDRLLLCDLPTGTGATGATGKD